MPRKRRTEIKISSTEAKETVNFVHKELLCVTKAVNGDQAPVRHMEGSA